MTHISLENLTLSYNKDILFKNFNFTPADNKWTCLLGTSGVGKSTLLRFIANLDTGCNAHTKMGSLNDTGPLTLSFMPQKNTLMPWLNTLDNVLISKRLTRKITIQDKQQAHHLLEKVGLAKAIKKYPHELSGGMQQRVSIARILFENRNIILMDEPFSALDAITRLNLQDLASEFLKNRTVLFVTHDPLEALRLSDTIYVLSGSPAQLSDPIKPAGIAPRDVGDVGLLKLQGELLGRLRVED